MILGMAVYTNIALSPVSTRAASDTAQYVAVQSDKERRRMRATNSLGLGIMGDFTELYSTFKECSIENWDGHGAAPLTSETFDYAYHFLNALPLGITAPQVGAEPDGHITMEWYKTPRRLLSVSISPEGELHYAALMGRKKRYGTEPFWGDVPEVITELINQVAD